MDPQRISEITPATAIAKALKNLQIQRTPILRVKTCLKQLEKGTGNLEAYLAQQVGEIQSIGKQCWHCSRGNGPFQECVIVEGGFFRGSCANCRYNDEQTRCSFRKDMQSGEHKERRQEKLKERQKGQQKEVPNDREMALRQQLDAMAQEEQALLKEKEELEAQSKALKQNLLKDKEEKAEQLKAVEQKLAILIKQNEESEESYASSIRAIRSGIAFLRKMSLQAHMYAENLEADLDARLLSSRN